VDVASFVRRDRERGRSEADEDERAGFHR
jgi:hypothetical protein